MLVNGAVKSKIEEVLMDRSKEDSFFVLDLAALDKQIELWQAKLPFVKPHYAVKCNDHPRLLAHLASKGLNFDCASRNEIRKVVEEHQVDPQRIIYANPVKAPSHVKFASLVGVKRMTFDNTAELHKIKDIAPQSELLLRIKTDDSGAVCSLSCKYGAAITETELLIEDCKKLGLNLVGVSYHVGSGGGVGPEAHAKALQDARYVFDVAANKFGFELKLLDIGGGFGKNVEEFSDTAVQIEQCLKNLRFSPTLEIIGEPGRFIAEPALVLVSNVIGIRSAPPQSDEVDMVYITDGVYGNLNSIIYDHQTAQPYLVGDYEVNATREFSASLWGPTCDGLDSITDVTAFPRRLEVGDWLYFVNAGAYTIVGGSNFNGFNDDCEVFVVSSLR